MLIAKRRRGRDRRERFTTLRRQTLRITCLVRNAESCPHTFTPLNGFKMSSIVHSWKSFTAHECNKILNRTGKFWEREPFDRYIRNQRHFDNALVYIEGNPVKAGLCQDPTDWRWSSARRRYGTHASGVL